MTSTTLVSRYIGRGRSLRTTRTASPGICWSAGLLIRMGGVTRRSWRGVLLHFSRLRSSLRENTLTTLARSQPVLHCFAFVDLQRIPDDREQGAEGTEPPDETGEDQPNASVVEAGLDYGVDALMSRCDLC